MSKLMDDDIEIGHFDDSEEFDDSLYYAPSLELPCQVAAEPIISRVEPVFGLLPELLIRIILQSQDMKTFVNLGTTSKSIRKLYNKTVWAHKFDQYKVKVEIIPNEFEQCLNLLRLTTIYEVADMYIHKYFGPYGFGTYTLKLHMKLPNKVLDTIITFIGYERKVCYKHAVTAYNIDVFFYWTTVEIKYYEISREKFREFIFILFRDGYLHKKWM